MPGRTNAADLLPCVHEEATCRWRCKAWVLTHVMVRTVDTDVFSHRIAKFQYIFLSKLWIEFGVGKYLESLPAHDMFRSIGEEKSQGLLAFHPFAGCDQTLPFAHFDQKTAWEAWGAMDDVMAAFQALRWWMLLMRWCLLYS